MIDKLDQDKENYLIDLYDSVYDKLTPESQITILQSYLDQNDDINKIKEKVIAIVEGDVSFYSQLPISLQTFISNEKMTEILNSEMYQKGIEWNLKSDNLLKLKNSLSELEFTIQKDKKNDSIREMI